MECRGEPAERRSLGGEDEPDAQQPADVTGQMARLGQSPFQGRQRGRELSAELFARRSEADLAARPVEEPDSETGLEDAYGFADARLGDAHALSRAPDEAVRDALLGAGLSAWFADALVGLYQDYRRSGTDGYAAQVTDTIERLTGRPARSLDDLLAEIAPDFKATQGDPAGA